MCGSFGEFVVDIFLLVLRLVERYSKSNKVRCKLDINVFGGVCFFEVCEEFFE